MISFPNCKINLGLRVINKREDGYHNIETCFFPVQWKDILEIIPAEKTSIHLTGIEIPGDVNSNIVLKAYELLKKDFSIDPVTIHLHKIIPHGAGLGGGSSDGAYALRLLNVIFGLNLSVEKMKDYALKLGSDCPFFIESIPMLASGRGEVLKPHSISLSGFTLVIVKPDIQVSTVQAYAGISPQSAINTLESILHKPITQWKELLRNDFEESVFKQHPSISSIKQKLYQLGAVYASMSGSGSAVYGLFDANRMTIPNTEFKEMMVWSGQL
jgi:4-diphosphocytidyl-2-C-methyl-D-erythritol kinase